MEIDLREWFYYDETSPTCLRHAKDNDGRNIVNKRYRGDPAGSFVKRKNGDKFRIATNKFGKNLIVHRIIWELFNGEIPEGMVIDHLNGDPWDNRIENLRAVTQKINTKNRNKNRNRKNASNITGISFSYYKGVLKHVVASVIVDGKGKLKSFSISKYGYDKALELACRARLDFLVSDEEFTDRHIANSIYEGDLDERFVRHSATTQRL